MAGFAHVAQLELKVMSDFKVVQRALLSVTDKSGLVEFAKALSGFGVELVSTGGTAKALRDAGLVVKDISELTGFPEMLDGRVKTLHPVVHGGILHRREDPAHVEAVKAHGIGPIDMVVVNLYAFEKTAAKPGVAFEEIVENIDIGGPSMLRSAAKNFEDVAVVSGVDEYGPVMEEMAANGGKLGYETRWRLAKKAFAVTAAYDAGIASTLEGIAAPDRSGLQPSGASALVQGASPLAGIERAVGAGAEMPSTLRVIAGQKATLRYGENPHQKAALYTDGSGLGIANAEQLQGKELSYNNLVDLDACWALVSEFDATAVAIIKHTNPCGVGMGATVAEAYKRALAADPVSAFGGVIGVNRTVDGEAAAEIAKLFVEAVVAPEFTAEALAALAGKKNLRVLRLKPAKVARVVKQISGGFLVQDEDHGVVDATTLRVVSARKPTAEEGEAMLFAWKVCKHVKSNAIVYARLDAGFGQTVGVGAGQMSRVDAAKFGAVKAALPLAGTVAASDAFFPFPDGLEAIAEAGATAVIQPGGSMRDAEVVAAADRLGMAMVMTGVRHFRHG
jgi:phosphoribosylaminoimidazolecarboxamide formyltransferase/IMP cyclohydrolase